jgi:CheY-like chemotaxis protein
MTQKETTTLKKINVLIAEDNPLNQLLISTIMDKEKIAYDIAKDGLEAIDFLKKKEYSILFLDIQMPRLDGWETAKIIREELKLDIRIVALTANDAANDESAFYQAGMNNYISKPYKKDALLDLIHKSAGEMKKSESDANPLFDTSNIERISSGDSEFVLSIITTFQKNVLLRLAEIEKGLAEKNSEIIQFSLHQLKSSIDILMINGIKETVLNLEKNILQKTITFELIADEFNTIKAHLLAVKEQMSQKF